MKTSFIYSFLFTLLLMAGCQHDHDQTTFAHLDGYVQKGPFLNGTEIMLSEMSTGLTPTGRVFTTQIIDNNGSFDFDKISLSSSIVALKADGFYFDEIRNENAAARLSLYALADISGKTSLNVNILTTLEKSRVEYLIDNGSSFSEAKQQAEAEILKIFEIGKSDIGQPEDLDITHAGDGNAVLLAISLILQGNLSVAALSELLAGIGQDVREDGNLDSLALGNTLVNNATYLNAGTIRQNLEKKYAALGTDVTIPNFEKYIQLILDSTDFGLTATIEYPENGENGTNLLDRNRTTYLAGIHSLCAILPAGTTLKVKLFGKIWLFPMSQDWSGWDLGEYNPADTSNTLISKKTGKIDLKVLVNMDTTNIRPKVIVYENVADIPTWSKEITIK